MYENGTPYLWAGETEWRFLTDDSPVEVKQDAIDFLASRRVNNLLITLANLDGTDNISWPWATSSSRWPWSEPRDRIDHRYFDLRKMQSWDKVIGHMAMRSVIADLWFYSDDSKKYLPAPFSPEEDLYFRYVIARFGAFWNVTWNLALEFSEYRPREWVEARARFVKLHDPYDRILAVHQIPATVYAFSGNPDLDRAALQSGKLSNDGFRDLVIDNRRMTAAAGRPVPIVNDEYYLEGIFMDQTRGRQATWVMLVSGAAGYRLGRLGILNLADWKSQEHFRITEVAVPWMEEKVRFWAIEPAAERVDPGKYCGEILDGGPPQFLVFSPRGTSLRLDLSGTSGRFSVEWLDPVTGERRVGPDVGGGSSVGLENPFGSREVVVLVSAR
jgi:hypothetical protein